jgi:carboxylesterase
MSNQSQQSASVPEFVRLDGGAHAILLLHGMGGSAFEVMQVARKLNRQGFTVHIPVLPGHRGSVAELAQTRWQEWYDAAERHFEALYRSHEQVSVAGLCLGALLALQVAARKGERVASVVSMSTTLAYDGWSIPWYRFLLPLVLHTPLSRFWSYKENAVHGIKNESMRRRFSNMLNDPTSTATDGAPASCIREMGALIKSTRRCLNMVLAPVLILHAKEDDIASTRNADYLEKHLGSVHVEKIILDDSYHVITLDNQRDIVAQEAGRFIVQHHEKAIRQYRHHGPQTAASGWQLHNPLLSGTSTVN